MVGRPVPTVHRNDILLQTLGTTRRWKRPSLPGTGKHKVEFLYLSLLQTPFVKRKFVHSTFEVVYSGVKWNTLYVDNRPVTVLS